MPIHGKIDFLQEPKPLPTAEQQKNHALSF